MNNNNTDNINIDLELQKLEKIKKVDTPPYLYTRIKQQIDSIKYENAPAEWKWGFALTMLIVIALNISTLFNTNTSNRMDQTAGIEEVVSSMHLSSKNEFYNNE